MSFKNHEDSADCWCGTTLLQVCPACEHEVDPPTWCRECSGTGTVPKYDDNLPIIVVHRDRKVKHITPERENLAAIGAFFGTAIMVALMAAVFAMAKNPRSGQPDANGVGEIHAPRDSIMRGR